MAQVRFLDQVPVTAFASDANQSPSAVRIPRVIQAGESLTIPVNTQGIGYDLYNLGGLITITGGEQVAGTDIYTHGLLQVLVVPYNLVRDLIFINKIVRKTWLK